MNKSENSKFIALRVFIYRKSKRFLRDLVVRIASHSVGFLISARVRFLSIQSQTKFANKSVNCRKVNIPSKAKI